MICSCLVFTGAMRTISSGMNACATFFAFDIYNRCIKKDISERQTLKGLFVSSFVIGVRAIITGIAMIGVKSILDLWWQLSGILPQAC